MGPGFWRARWEAGQIGFHRSDVHPDLRAHAPWLLGDPAEGRRRVLVPLCGKSHDLAWLAAQGCEVVGVELVRGAVEQLFAEAGLAASWRGAHGVALAEAGGISVWVADYLRLPAEALGRFNAVWDRAALVALDPADRPAYAARHRAVAAPGARLLLDVVQYDPAVMDGPPWPVTEAEVAALFPGAERVAHKDELDERWRARGHAWMRGATFAVPLG